MFAIRNGNTITIAPLEDALDGRAKSVAEARRIIVDLVKYTPMTSAATMQLARVDAYLYDQYRTA